MVPEIEKHSMNDVKYILVAVGCFWFIFYLFLTLDATMLRSLLDWLCCCWQKQQQNQSHQLQQEETTSQRRRRARASIWVRSSGYLIFVVLFQIVATGFATCGFMSLIRVPLNTTIYSIVFILMSIFK